MKRPLIRPFLPVLAILSAVALLSTGCGQRGPLYMPNEIKPKRNELTIDHQGPTDKSGTKQRDVTTPATRQ